MLKYNNFLPAMLGSTNITEKFIEFLAKESEGNAFFLVESIRALAEDAGRLDQNWESIAPYLRDFRGN